MTLFSRIKTQKPASIVFLCIAGLVFLSLVILVTYDLFRPIGGPSFSLSFFSKLPRGALEVFPKIGLVGFLLFLGLGVLSHYGYWRRVIVPCRAVSVIMMAVFVLPVTLMMVVGVIYEPIKFAYLSHRVESADTVEEEWDALMLAARFGDVWEFADYPHRVHWPEEALKLEGDSLLWIEWLESSLFTGRPYSAYRILLSKENYQMLRGFP